MPKYTLKKFVLPLLLLIICTNIFLLSRLIFFPYPELFVYSYLTQEGLLPYKQILDQHFPGIMFFPINLASLGIDTPHEMRVLLFALVAVTHTMLFLVSRRIFKTYHLSLIPNVLYLLWQPFFEGYVLWIDSFIPIFLLVTFYFLMDLRKRGWSYFLAGSFLGIALLFKQPVIIIFLLVTSYLFFNIKREGLYKFLIGFSIPIIAMLLYLFSIGVLGDFVYWAITFNITVFAEMGRKYPAFSDLVKLLPVFGLAIILSIYLISKKATKEVFLVSIFFLGSLSFAFARFDFVHLQPALPFAIILIALSLHKVKLAGLTKVGVIYLILVLPLLLSFYKHNVGQRILFFGGFEQELVLEIEKLTDPKDSIFAMGTSFHIYQMTKTLPPGRVFVFQFPWFMKVAESKVFAGILNDPPKVVIRDKGAEVSGMKLVNFMPRIESYVDKFYLPIKNVGGTEILVRR